VKRSLLQGVCFLRFIETRFEQESCEGKAHQALGGSPGGALPTARSEARAENIFSASAASAAPPPCSIRK